MNRQSSRLAEGTAGPTHAKNCAHATPSGRLRRVGVVSSTVRTITSRFTTSATESTGRVEGGGTGVFTLSATWSPRDTFCAELTDMLFLICAPRVLISA